jgi:hypothetical protein
MFGSSWHVHLSDDLSPVESLDAHVLFNHQDHTPHCTTGIVPTLTSITALPCHNQGGRGWLCEDACCSRPLHAVLEPMTYKHSLAAGLRCQHQVSWGTKRSGRG